jgi:transposase-like protein
MNIQNLSYKELVAEATAQGFEKASQTKKESLIEFLSRVEKEVKQKREKKPLDQRILDLADGNMTRREIAKALDLKYSDVYFALKKANLSAKPVKKLKTEIN